MVGSTKDTSVEERPAEKVHLAVLPPARNTSVRGHRIEGMARAVLFYRIVKVPTSEDSITTGDLGKDAKIFSSTVVAMAHQQPTPKRTETCHEEMVMLTVH